MLHTPYCLPSIMPQQLTYFNYLIEFIQLDSCAFVSIHCTTIGVKLYLIKIHQRKCGLGPGCRVIRWGDRRISQILTYCIWCGCCKPFWSRPPRNCEMMRNQRRTHESVLYFARNQIRTGKADI